MTLRWCPLSFALLLVGVWIRPSTAFQQVGPLLGGGSRTQPCIAKRHTSRVMALRMADDAGDADGLRTMFSPPWACMAKCGACCYLAPAERDLSGLSDDEREVYIGMAGPDGWCTNFDRKSHLCTIYDTRPGFCRIESLGPMYAVPESELGDFAADSCRDHIDQLYGEDSPEIERFEVLQDSVREAAGWVKMEEEVPVMGGKSRKEELLEARHQLLLAIDSLPADDSSAAVGLKDMLKQLEEAIAALELNPKT
mmetsp:Transcript_71874/g.105312  ORF Transcript_71874/g.105312 Transcript_71874/m.105312 type:complete len:253 (-) Transcript_71874:333-1091(-)